MIGGDDLEEGFGFGAVGFVTAGAGDGGVELGGLYGSGIVGMLGLGSVASFAGDDDVLAELLLIDHVGVAGLADIVTGEGRGAGSDLSDGGAAIVSILAETVGNDEGAQANERDQGDGHDDRKPDEMFDVLEQAGLSAPDSGRQLRTKLRNALE